ncbi:MAG: ATP-binding protein [Spirochaetota bacterium]|jgi:anti-sigma B factor antagonist|nr:ATP-binding protein [Spirochaetota bacterium]
MANLVFEDASTVLISGSLDILCTKEIKAAFEGKAFYKNLILDMRAVDYVDSAGLGVLIFLYKKYNPEGVRIRVLPSDTVLRILVASDLAQLFLAQDDLDAGNQPVTIRFYDCFAADTNRLGFIIDRLYSDLAQAGYCDEEKNEIVTALDEAITNAIFETIREVGGIQTFCPNARIEKSPKAIVVSWKITPDDFSVSIADYGSGLDLNKQRDRIPKTDAADYLSQVQKYQQDCNLSITVNGQAVELQRLGVGLKIITNLMDHTHITLFDQNDALPAPDSTAAGTILALHRARRFPLAH